MTKQVFAIRLLEAITGLEYKKRLQTMIGVPLPEGVAELMAGLSAVTVPPGVPLPDGVAELMAGLPEITVPPGIFSTLSPLFVAVWGGGPVHLTQAIEGEIIVPTILKAKIDISTAANITVIAAVAERKISISSIVFTVAGETNITLKSGATAISGAMDFGGTNEPRGMSHGMGDMPLQTAAGEAFVIANSIAVQVSGWITYYLS